MAPSVDDILTVCSSKVADSFFQYLHKNFISMQDDERKIYVKHFMKVLENFTLLMKDNDKLFSALFQKPCGAGSYFDGLRVSSATEFDMDIVMRLPINYKEVIIHNEDVPPAFTKIRIERALDLLRQHPEWSSTYRYMDSWRDCNGYLLQTKFRTWIESVVNKALNVLPKTEKNAHKLVVKDDDDPEKEWKYLITLKKSGPAMTLNIQIPDLGLVDVDLVPVIEFQHPQWPPQYVRQLPDKPKMLNKLNKSLVNKKIPYFWDQRYNLLEGMTDEHFKNYVGRLNKVCKNLKNKLIVENDTKVLAEYLLSKSELEKWKTDFELQEPPSPANSMPVINEMDSQTSLTSVYEMPITVPNGVTPTDRLQRMLCALEEKIARNNSLMEEMIERVKSLENSVATLVSENKELKYEVLSLKNGTLVNENESNNNETENLICF